MEADPNSNSQHKKWMAEQYNIKYNAKKLAEKEEAENPKPRRKPSKNMAMYLALSAVANR